MNKGLGWLGIVRLGLVQSAIGAVVVLCTATFNRVMVVEMALPASLPAGLVAWHYVVQLSRPSWGFGSDRGRGQGACRTRFILAGMAMLSVGALLAAVATARMAVEFRLALALAVVAFALIGAGVAAAGTTLLALLASRVAPARRPAAAAIAWVMMIIGIVMTAATAGHFLDPYSPARLVAVAAAVALAAFVVAALAVAGMERATAAAPAPRGGASGRFRDTLKDIWSEPLARDFTLFVFLSMLAYSAQELIMEPFAALVFGYSVGHSTQLAGVQQGGVLLGMVGTGLLGTLIRGDRAQWMRGAILLGCFASAAALVLLAMAAFAPQHYPLRLIAFALGFANGVFAVSAIGLMMAFAGSGQHSGEGVRMGVWGAAQAIAFAIGGFAGAAGLDLLRHHGSTAWAFAGVFGAEAVLFTVAALFALRLRGEAACLAPARAWEGVS